MTDLKELIERVEKATETDPNLFRAACVALLPEPEPFTQAAVDVATIEAFIVAEAYTDAALALTERVMPGCAIERASCWPHLVGGETPTNRHAYATLLPLDARGYGDHTRRKTGEGSTLPLAILSSLLRALQEQK